MRIKDKIIKRLGGHTKDEYVNMRDDLLRVNQWKAPQIPIVGKVTKQIHNIELRYTINYTEELKDETIIKFAKDELKKALIDKLEEDEFIEFKESDYEIKLLLQVVK